MNMDSVYSLKPLSKRTFEILNNNKDAVLPFALLLVIGSLFLPIPPFILSVLIIINLGLSILILVTSLLITTPLQLSSYPTILLLTTIFRLTLSVSATRNIIATGDAGEVITTLGHLTARNDPLIGAIMFSIILVVQFLVVGKGAERVAEVAARFTLDAMPGKQMAIDADLRAGLCTQEQARERRSEIQKESQFHGAMDGAMKFVKGDSIATIIIAFVNIIAGLFVGVTRKNLDISMAAKKYMILTFGDGLAAIIASLLITISAGIVVTKVQSSQNTPNVGTEIGAQIFSKPRNIFITGIVLFLLTPISILFGLIGLSLIGASYFFHKKAGKIELESQKKQPLASSAADSRQSLQLNHTVPFALVVSRELSYLIDGNTPQGINFRQKVNDLRSSIYFDTGILLPQCSFVGGAALPPNEYFIAVKEIPAVRGKIFTDRVYVNDSADNIKVFGLEGVDMKNPANLKPGSWIPLHQKDAAMKAGLRIWESSDVFILHLAFVLKKYAHDFIGIQESQGYLDFVSSSMPTLVQEVIPKIISINQFTDILQKLAQEGISVKDTKTILDLMSQLGRIEKDPTLLSEHLRASLRRYITFKYTANNGHLFAILLDPEIEDVIRGAIHRTQSGGLLNLEPSISGDILDSIKRVVTRFSPRQTPVIITDSDIRRFVKNLIDADLPEVAVLSYQELIPKVNIQPIGRVSLDEIHAV